jgi:hypothetical protein
MNEMSKIAIHFYDTVECTGEPKIVRAFLTPDGKLPVASLKEKFGVTTLEEIDDGEAFLIGADEHGVSHNPFSGKTAIKVTGDLKGNQNSYAIMTTNCVVGGAADRIWWNATGSIQASLNTKGHWLLRLT